MSYFIPLLSCVLSHWVSFHVSVLLSFPMRMSGICHGFSSQTGLWVYVSGCTRTTKRREWERSDLSRSKTFFPKPMANEIRDTLTYRWRSQSRHCRHCDHPSRRFRSVQNCLKEQRDLSYPSIEWIASSPLLLDRLRVSTVYRFQVARMPLGVDFLFFIA